MATIFANEAAQHMLEDQPAGSRKRKAYTTFTSEQRAKRGKYVAEHGNKAAL